MTIRKSVVASVFGVLSLGLVLAAPMHGAERTVALRTNYLTFSGPVALPGVTLQAGTYIFERVLETEPDVVVVRDRDRSKVFYMAFTERTARPAGMKPGQMVSFGEARPGTAPPIAAWYPIGSSAGHRFVYGAR
jgi:hypothetical protein